MHISGALGKVEMLSVAVLPELEKPCSWEAGKGKGKWRIGR